MATHNLTYKFGNNFENENSSGAVSIPAEIQAGGSRGTVPPVFIGASDVIQAFVIPENCIVKNFYLVVEEAMTGTVTVNLDDGSNTAVFPALTSITSVGIAKSTLEDVYVTTPYNLVVTFSDAQTAGAIKLAFDFVQLDTNTAKYINK